MNEVNEHYAGSQIHVLLVDSDIASSARRCGQLASFGWCITEAGNPHEALRVAGSEAIELVLLQMTPQQAIESDLPSKLRDISNDIVTPIVIISDEPGFESQRCQCLDDGVDDILPASTGTQELQARLSALLRMKNLHDALEESRKALQDALRREHELLAELQADNDLLHKQVITDPLTRLYNVRYFEKFIKDELSIARRYGHKMGLLMLDMDHFKLVNDQHGHPMGDFVLKEFSVLLKRTVRDSDVVARTGGEEFSVVLPRADRAQCDSFAERILKAVSEHVFENGSTRLQLTCSIGSACFGDDADVTGSDQLIYFADQALLEAKQSGRNQVIHWGNMDDQIRQRLRSHFSSASISDTAKADANYNILRTPAHK